MNFLPQVIFILALIAAGFFLTKRIKRIRDNIKLGKPKNISDNPSERLKTMLLVAFGQKKMFDKPLIGFMHLFVYLGFVIINLEMLEIVIDGITGNHRIFSAIGSLYPVLINFFEFLAVTVIICCAIFLIRRNILKVRRFWAREMTSWPRTDANLILITEIALMIAFLTMDATDGILQSRGAEHYTQTGSFFFSGLIQPLFSGLDTNSLILVERFAWWFHILGVMAFAVYITWSKHLHIFLAFPNTYFSDLKPKGKITNMPEVTREVKSMLGIAEADGTPQNDAPQEISRFGAKDINDLSWKNLMDAYSCTECGRCTANCPANITGKLLSPRKIMMDTRDRMEDVGKSLEKGGPGLSDGKTLLDDYILREELFACTSCQACVQVCPVNIDPLSIIISMRRFISMEESKAPGSWNSMFSNIETNFSPWKFSPSDRGNWVNEVK
jgi:heterodisulfide reductase subunit C